VQPLPCYLWSDALLSSAPPPITVSGLRVEASALQERILRHEFGSRFGVAPVRATIIAGEPAASLAQSAADADLLAVGRSQPRWRFLRRSIGDRCSQLFDGPIVMVPPDDNSSGRDRDRRRAHERRTHDAHDVSPAAPLGATP